MGSTAGIQSPSPSRGRGEEPGNRPASAKVRPTQRSHHCLQDNGLCPERRKPFRSLGWLDNPEEGPPRGGAGLTRSSYHRGSALSWETSHFLSHILAIFIYGAASFSQGGHLGKIKMPQGNHRPKYVSDETRPPLNVPLAWRVQTLPPRGNGGRLSWRLWVLDSRHSQVHPYTF